MLMFIAILLSGILLAAEIYFYLKALDRGRALAYGLADESRFINCTSCGRSNKRQRFGQTCRACYKPY